LYQEAQKSQAESFPQPRITRTAKAYKYVMIVRFHFYAFYFYFSINGRLLKTGIRLHRMYDEQRLNFVPEFFSFSTTTTTTMMIYRQNC